MVEPKQISATDTIVSQSGQQIGRLHLFRSAAVMGAAFLGSALALGAETETNEIAQRESEIPEFVFEPLYAANRGLVYGVYEGRHADLILIAGGYDSGFRSGMVCQVKEGAADVAEIIMVDVRENSSAALIRDLEPENVIAPGQSVRIKTVNL